MGVYQRAERGNIWMYRFKANGRTYKSKCVMPDGTAPRNRYEALQCEQAEREKIARRFPRRERETASISRHRDDVSLEEIFAWHLAKIEPTASEQHLLSFARHAREAIDYFGPGRRVVDIGQDDVDEFRREVIKRPRRVYVGGPRRPLKEEDPSDESLWKILEKRRSPSEQNHVLNALRSAFNAASKQRDSRGDPVLAYPPTVEGVHIPKRKPTPMRAEEFERRRAEAKPWIQDAMDLARWFGLRLREVLRLEVRHMQWDKRVLTLGPDENKSGHEQDVLGGEVGWAVAVRLAGQARRRGTTFLVTWPGVAGWRAMERGEEPARGSWQPLNSIRRGFQGTAERADLGEPRRFHDIRAAYITEVASKVRSAASVQKLARHESFATTGRYIDLADNELADQMRQVDKFREEKARKAPARGGLKVVKR